MDTKHFYNQRYKKRIIYLEVEKMWYVSEENKV